MKVFPRIISLFVIATMLAISAAAKKKQQKACVRGLIHPLDKYTQIYNGTEVESGEVDLMESRPTILDAEKERIVIFDEEAKLIEWARENGLSSASDALECINEVSKVVEEYGIEDNKRFKKLLKRAKKLESEDEYNLLLENLRSEVDGFEKVETMAKKCQADSTKPEDRRSLSGLGFYHWGPWFNTGAILSLRYPLLLGNWNNRISSFEVIGLYTVFCDRFFWRGPRFLVWHPCCPVNFAASFNGLWINDRTGSTF